MPEPINFTELAPADPLDGSETTNIIQDGSDKKVTVDAIAARAGEAARFTANFLGDGAGFGSGDFTNVNVVDVDGETLTAIPRENAVGATVLAPSGDNPGLWTITASGPCTPADPAPRALERVAVASATSPSDSAYLFIGTNTSGPSDSTDPSATANAFLLVNPTADVAALEGAVSAVEGTTTTLENRLNRYYPPTPVKPTLHVSKYVTFDPDFPLDGTATHVGGQEIEEGQNLTILDNSSDNGGVWTMSLVGPATRAQGFGSMVSTDIGNYDHVSYTGTKWAYFALFRLYGDATTKGLAPDPPATGITGGEGVSRSYQACLIATDITGDDLTVLEADGSTTVLSVAAQTGPMCVLVLDDLELATIAAGAVTQTEAFDNANGLWLSRGVGGAGDGVAVSISHGTATILSGNPTP